MYALVLCERTDQRFSDYPLCPDEDVAGSRISFTSENKFLWSPFTHYDINFCPWDHLALGIPHDLDISGIGKWESSGTLHPSYSDEKKKDAAVAIEIAKLQSVFSSLPDFTDISNLSAKIADIDLDELMEMANDLKVALAT